MIWIPIMYICLTNGGCAFLQGNPTYTEKGCIEQLAHATVVMQKDPQVVAFDGTCLSLTPT